MNKDWNMSLKFLGEVTPLLLKNNLRIILGSKSEKFKNLEAQQKGRYSCKKRVFYKYSTAYSTNIRLRILQIFDCLFYKYSTAKGGFGGAFAFLVRSRQNSLRPG